MKNLLTIIALALGLSAAAQTVSESEVPAVIRNSVKNEYPNIKVQEWRKDGNRYEVEYAINGVGACLVYDKSGSYIESEKKIGFQEIPHSIQQYVAAKMAGQKISEASRIVTAVGNMYYEVVIDGKAQYFDPQGKHLPARHNDSHAGHDH